MAIQVPDAGKTADKWGTRTSAASGDYQAGVSAPKKDWGTETANAAGNFKAAVSAGNIQARFANGVKKAGTAKWQEAAKGKGAQRFSGGVAAGKAAYSEGVAPYLSTLQGVTLPARQPRGDAANIERVRAVAVALNQKKLSMSGAGV